MRAARRHLSTVTVAASTALVTALVVAGGPALATTVVDFAKNAGAVNGKKAVAANASVAQRKGKLVATGGLSGQLPNNIIARAPDSSKLQGVPLSGLAVSYLDVDGTWLPTTAMKTICRTPVFVPKADSVATMEVSETARATTVSTLAVIYPVLSGNGGVSFDVVAAPTGATSAPNAYSSATTHAVAQLKKGRSYVFAEIGNAGSTMNDGLCSVAVQISAALPGTRVVKRTQPMTMAQRPGTELLR